MWASLFLGLSGLTKDLASRKCCFCPCSCSFWIDCGLCTHWVKYCRNYPRELLSQRVFVYIPIVNKRAGLPLGVIVRPCRIGDRPKEKARFVMLKCRCCKEWLNHIVEIIAVSCLFCFIESSGLDPEGFLTGGGATSSWRFEPSGVSRERG